MSAGSKYQIRDRIWGVAAIEFALVCPLLILIVFSSIEIGFLLYKRNLLLDITQAGIHMAATNQTQTGSALITLLSNQIQTNLTTMGFNPTNIQITFSPVDPSSVTRGTQLNLSIAVPLSQMVPIQYIASGILPDPVIVQAIAAKEY